MLQHDSERPPTAAMIPARQRSRRWVRWGVAVVAVAASMGSLVAWRASSAAKTEKKPEVEKSFEFAASDLARV